LAAEKELLSSAQTPPQPRGLVYILFSVFGFLLGRSFSSSRSHSTQEHVIAIRDNHKTERQNNQPPPEIKIRAELCTPEYVERQRAADNDRNYRLQKWLTIGTWLAFLAAAIYAGITLKIWHEMQVQTNVQRQAYVTAQRPWVKVKHRIIKPLTFNVPAWKGPVASMLIEDTLENVGPTIALNVFSWEDVIPINGDYTLRDARARQNQWCDASRHRDINHLSGYMLFPKDPFVQNSTVGPPMEAVIKAAEANSIGLPGKVGFVLVGCICYRSSFEPTTNPFHETRFIYYLGKPDGEGGIQPFVQPTGIANDLQLVKFPDGFSAD
jgi:hypothetical protein